MVLVFMVLHGVCAFARARVRVCVFPCRGPVAEREALNCGRTFVAAKWNFKRRMVALQNAPRT